MIRIEITGQNKKFVEAVAIAERFSLRRDYETVRFQWGDDMVYIRTRPLSGGDHKTTVTVTPASSDLLLAADQLQDQANNILKGYSNE